MCCQGRLTTYFGCANGLANDEKVMVIVFYYHPSDDGDILPPSLVMLLGKADFSTSMEGL